MKNIAVLGSTGSIGTQTLDVVRGHRELFHISVLAANVSDELLEKQIREFEPELAVLSDEAAYARLKSRYTGKTKLAGGRQAFIDAAAYPDVDTVVTSMMGFAGLEPTMKALDAKKNIALANKETLVVAGEIVMRRAKEQGVSILPVDSEHCAFFQCLQGEKRETIEKLLLTCSGGPFRGKKREALIGATKAQVLAHPTWNMGQKITVDSASLVNKGLEVIEAKWLYGVDYDKIQVVVHPQSIIHSMVQFHDASIVAQMGTPDMRVPIAYALSWPQRIASGAATLDFSSLGAMTFESVDAHGHPERFPSLPLVWQVLRAQPGSTAVLNAANEVAVASFLDGRIRFDQIHWINADTLAQTSFRSPACLEDLLELDRSCRERAQALVGALQP